MAARIYNLEDARRGSCLKGASCAFGVFDGFHVGHRHLVDQAISSADAGAGSAVITFDIDPDELFRPASLSKLMSNEERLQTLAESGVDALVVLRFDRAFANQSPDVFLEAIFGPEGQNAPASLHIGNNFRFGRNASGTVADLQAWGAGNGMEVVPHDLVEKEGDVVSSMRIRKLFEDGDEDLAFELLGLQG